MEKIYFNKSETVRVFKATEGVFGSTYGLKDSNGRSSGKYLVLSPYGRFYWDTRIDAMNQGRFFAGQERFREAKEAGLNDETAELVAAGRMSLSAALGDMDMDAEVHYMINSDYVNECEDDPEDDGFDPDLHGGEDDNTPPLEVLMAGGWAAWEWQNEKNAYLDSRL